jgi:nucleoside-diphosphate kinase
MKRVVRFNRGNPLYIIEGVFGMERTFLMVKPDGVQRNLIGEIVSRFENKGFQLVGAKLMQITEELAEQHYGEHKERPFFGELVEFITSGPVFAMVWEGENVISTARLLVGATNPTESAPGTIRGDFAVTVGKNIIHGSDSSESAVREIGLFFKEEELVSYDKVMNNWIN